MSDDPGGATYVLPIRRSAVDRDDDLTAYLTGLRAQLPVVVVDGSPPDVFAAHRYRWPSGILHVPVDPALAALNGKVAGVRTAMKYVGTERVIVADDDVRYDRFALRRVCALLNDAEIVRPQNYFRPLPWHARLDTARTLLNRISGGDWPGTLAFRRSAYDAAGGYDGDVLFENLELVRTIRAAGGRERVASDCFVLRRPPSVAQYLDQRIRQAYDEFARPARLAVQLAVMPLFAFATARFGPRAAGVFACAAIAAAEAGRRRDGGPSVFPCDTPLYAPLWLLERGVTSWCAIALRLTRGGVRYSNGRLRIAAHSLRSLRMRYGAGLVPPRAQGARP